MCNNIYNHVTHLFFVGYSLIVLYIYFVHKNSFKNENFCYLVYCYIHIWPLHFKCAVIAIPFVGISFNIDCSTWSYISSY